MLCDNCKKREANVRYSENINGVKRELNLCEECSQKLGIGKMNFDLPMSFSSFFGDLIEDFARPEFIPTLGTVKTLKCDNCGYTFDDIVNTGRLGCANCYDVFDTKLEGIIKNMQGSNKHIGRTGKMIDQKIDEKHNKTNSDKNENKPDNKLNELKKELKNAIKEERYEDAAKLRDEIKKLEK